MRSVEAEQVLIFTVSQKEFIDWTAPLSDEELTDMEDLGVINCGRPTRRCYMPIKKAVQIPESFKPEPGIRVRMSQEAFLRLIEGDAELTYLSAIEKEEISDVGIHEGQAPNFSFVGREIVGREDIINNLFPQLASNINPDSR